MTYVYIFIQHFIKKLYSIIINNQTIAIHQIIYSLFF